jgi:hypothetical protein
MDYEFDVTLSFAGENRDYVEKVASVLEKEGVKVFYDKFEQADLWGKDLGIHFDYVYRKSAKYCIPFISEFYKKKVWTNYEIRTAIARAIESNEEYILPARFDDTEIEGIRPTLGYIDLRDFTPEKFAALIIQKLKREPGKPIVETTQTNKGKIYLSVSLLTSGTQLIDVCLRVNITNVEKEYRYFNEPAFEFDIPFDGADAFYLVDKLQPRVFPKKLEYGEVYDVSYILRASSREGLWEKLDPNTKVKAVVTTTVGEKYYSNEIESAQVLRAFKFGASK